MHWILRLPCAASEMLLRIADGQHSLSSAPLKRGAVWQRSRLLCFAALMLTSMAPVGASPSQSPCLNCLESFPLGQPVIVELTLNRVKRGAYPIVLRAGGDFLLRGVDLGTMGVTLPSGSASTIDDEEYFSLRDLGATAVRFDEASLALYADLPAERLPKQGIDFLGQKSPAMIPPSEHSVFFNYRLLNSGNDVNGAESWLLGGELGVRINELLFRTEAAHNRYENERETIRYGSSITYDNRENLQRLVVGDFVASSGLLGKTLSFGGISFSKSYTIDPYFIYQPMAGFVGTVNAPSEVEVYLDGMRLRSDTLAPGEFELKNLNYYGGRRDLEMVIRDTFGREQRFAYPYYFSGQNLRQGLHDYSYNAGWVRNGVGTANDEYGDWAVSAYHRYGLSDVLTFGVRGEAEAARFNLGPIAVIRLNRWGVVSGAVSRSGSERDTGWAASAGYLYQAKEFHLQGAWRRYSPGYETVASLETEDRPEQEVAVSTGYGVPGFGRLGLGYRHLSQYQGSDQKVFSLSYSRTFYRAWNLMAAVTKTATSEESSTGFYINLSYHPGHSVNTTLSHQQNEDGYSDIFQISNTTPVGEGLGYRITADRSMTDVSERVHFSPSVQYNGRYGIVSAALHSESQTGAGTTTGYQWGVSGGIGYVADSVNFARPITDSFAVIEVGDIEGVRVYHSSQEIGRTDKEGRVFLPNLGSYRVNRIAVDDSDIPINYTIGARELNVSPPLRSGSLIHFDVKRFQAVSGYLRVKLGSDWVPVEYATLRVDADGIRKRFPTGRDGEFYLEDLAPARYRARFEYRGVHCDFELAVPASEEMIIELGELNVCETTR